MNKIFILKIMRKPVLSFVWALLLHTSLSAQYESAIKSAIINLDFYEEEICATANRFKQNPREVMAVVFPEMIRYNLVKDFFETSALELIYANLGSREVDFSIGIFQMKPSFIEKLEDIIIQNPTVFSEYLFVAKYDVSDEQSVRRERLRRLKSSKWQILYAFAFYAVADACFWAEDFCTPQERTAFYAAAYNLGFDAKISSIRNWAPVKAFPYGRKFDGVQLSYAQLAVDYYDKYFTTISCPGILSSTP